VALAQSDLVQLNSNKVPVQDPGVNDFRAKDFPRASADALAAEFPKLTLRTEPEHEEAFIPLGAVEVSAAQWQLVSDTLFGWAAQQQRRPSELGVRITYLASRPLTPDSRPDLDFAVPLAV